MDRSFSPFFGPFLEGRRAAARLRADLEQAAPRTEQAAPRRNTHQPAPWTAARCHRLLRPLLVSIASLRKERFPTADESTRAQGGAGKRGADGDGAPSGRDKKKRKIVQYSSRTSGSQAPPEAPEAPEVPSTPQAPPQQRITANRAAQPIPVPTPFLRRIRNHEMSSPMSSPSRAAEIQEDVRLPEGRARAALSSQLSRPPGPEGRERLALQAKVFNALEVLLATTCPHKTPGAEPRSLMAMCLRKVPECIAELEWWEQKEARENGTKSTLTDSQATMDVYSDLEGLGATEGWKHLSVVVRVHGMRIVHEAVEEGLFDDSFTELLLRLCGEHLPLAEFEDTVDSFIFRQYPTPDAAVDEFFHAKALRPLVILSVIEEINEPFRMRKLGELLASGMLPNRWMLGLDISWTLGQAMVRLTRGVVSEDVISFLAVALEQYCRLESAQQEEQPKLFKEAGWLPGAGEARRALAWAVATVASVPLLAKEVKAPSEAAREKMAALKERARLVLETSISNIRNEQTGQKHQVSSYALSLGAFLALGSEDAGEAIKAAWQAGYARLETRAFLYDTTTAVVGAIAFLVGHAAPTPTRRPLSHLCRKLRKKLRTLEDLPYDATGILVHSAYVLAANSGALPDLAYAEALQERYPASRPQHRSRVAAVEGPYHGFTWDDSIGEWIRAYSEGRHMSLNLVARRGNNAPRRPFSGFQPEFRAPNQPPRRRSVVERENMANFMGMSPTALAPRTTHPPRATQPPRRPRADSLSSEDSEESDVGQSSPAPPPRPTRGRPSVSAPPVFESSDDDNDELGQEATGSGSRPLPAGRVAAVRTQGGVVRRSASLRSLVESESSGDELSFA